MAVVDTQAPVTTTEERTFGTREDVWPRRHRAILLVAWAHAIIVPLFGLTRNSTLREALYESAPVAGFALIGTLPGLSRRSRAVSVTLSLLASSAILVHFASGQAEMHFHFFVMVALVALYQDWLPFVVAIVFTIAHHTFLGTIAPDLVYDRPLGPGGAMRSAAWNAFFVGAISAVSFAGWRINRAVLIRQEQAEGELLEQKRTVETLHAIGTGVVSELDMERVAQLVTDEAVKALGAAFGAFFYNVHDSSGDGYMLYTLSGVTRSAFDRFPMPRNTKIFAPTFSGSAVMRLDDVTRDERYGQNAPYHGMPPGHLPVRSYLAVPVRSRGSSEVLGGLFFGHPEAGVFTQRDEELAVGIATQAAVAFDNARLYQAEREALGAAELARSRLSLLAEAGRVLVASLDPDDTLLSIGRITVPALADMCVIDLCEDETIRRVDVFGAPGLEQIAEQLRDYPPDPSNTEHGVVRVINGGPSELNEGPSPATVDKATRSTEHAEIVRRMDITTSIVVPLIGRGLVLGALSFHALGASGRRFTSDDLALAEEIGRRGGMAIENARLFDQQQTVAKSLQHALLPHQLPQIPGFEATARYLPAGPGERVGGDWYDMFQVPSGQIAIVMGDVVGHGIPAASLMAQLRNALRAYVWDGLAPAEVLNRLNQLLYGLEREGMATVSLALLDPVSSNVRLASAGHPPLLQLSSGREATFFGEGLGPPLGAVPFARFGEKTIELRAEELLVFYTDGLVEDREMSLDEGLDVMREAVSEDKPTVNELADHVIETCLGSRVVDDDVALLIVRALPLGPRLHLRLAPRPEVLASFRQTLRRWLHANSITGEDAYAVLIASGEACNNAIEHGASGRDGSFEIEVDLDEDLTVVVRSRGGWRDPRPAGGGRGLRVMEGLMDEVAFDRSPDGTEVRMRLKLGGHGIAS